MQASQNEIHGFLLEYTGAHNRVQSDRFKRDQIRLEFEGAAPATAKLRDLRTSCCMIDIGNSIFTLNFRDIISFNIPNDPGVTMPVLTVRLGSLARDMNARMARDTRRSSWFERPESSYTQPRRKADTEQGIPLNPPGGKPAAPALQLDAGEQEPAPYNRIKREEQPAATSRKSAHEAAKERQSLDEIDAMLRQMWKEPGR